jgi:succinate dehydrogenase / fumarate reductase flavoprotein subunit
MDRLVGIFRVEGDLTRAMEELEKLKARAAKVRIEGSRMYNPGWHLTRDLQNLLTVSEAITRSALLRKESRGAHSRLDHPGPDAALGKVNLRVKKAAAGMSVEPTPLPEMPADLQALFDAAPAAPGAAAAAPQPAGRTS